ncbi:hypothetical protein HDU76_010848 [Blyttiomyces sp. JEL0837]|nr:hypothetical protein HDU76_010848 [Blyttiomyces sp. JEL0837]
MHGWIQSNTIPDLASRLDLFNLLKTISGQNAFPRLDEAIAKFNANIQSQHDSQFSFDRDLLPFIVQKARNKDILKSVTLKNVDNGGDRPRLVQGKSGQITLTSAQVLCIMSNAFFLNLHLPENFTSSKSDKIGNLDLTHLYTTYDFVLGTEKIVCWLAYFYVCLMDEKGNVGDRSITYVRVKYDIGLPSDDELGQVKVAPSKSLNFTTGSMTDLELLVPSSTSTSSTSLSTSTKDQTALVDFANKRIHVQRVLPSCTQEEIVFLVCPEAYIGMLIFETLEDNEIAAITNLRMVTKYTGFGDSFEFKGITLSSSSSSTLPGCSMLLMDATYQGHFQPSIVVRDICKAYHGFKTMLELNCNAIATGAWGCGFFGGQKEHKMLQQVVAFSFARRAVGGKDNAVLHYSVYGARESRDLYEKWFRRIDGMGWSVLDLYRLVALLKEDESIEEQVETWLK